MFIGGLIASGWHVAAMFMRLMADSLLLDSTCLGSPGVDTLKWAKPVQPRRYADRALDRDCGAQPRGAGPTPASSPSATR